MSASHFATGRLLWVAVAVGLTAGLAWWTWRRAELPVGSNPVALAPAFVQVAGSGSGANDQVLRERAELFDPTPLFFPTERNYGYLPSRLAMQREPVQVFASIDPQFTFPEQSPKFAEVQAGKVPQALSEVLAQGNQIPFGGLGHVDMDRAALPARQAFLEVTSFAGGEPVLAQPLAGLTLPRPDFAPLEFVVVVGSGGVIGEPVLASGSGVEEVDVFFRLYLLNPFRLGERVMPGRYRVMVGP